ncbi:hypothetical protein ACSSZE_14635 [Acidithiobacillus caldus]
MLLRFMAQDLSGKASQGRFSREYVDSLVCDPVPLHREEPSISPQDEVTAPFAVPREPSLMVVPSQSSADVARKRLGVKASPVKPGRRRTVLWVGIAGMVLLIGGATSVYMRPMWISSMVPGLSGIFPARVDFARPVAPVTKPHPWVNPASIAYTKAKAEASIPPVTSSRTAAVPPVVATAHSSRGLAPVFAPPTARDKSAPTQSSVLSPVESAPAGGTTAVGTPAVGTPVGGRGAVRGKHAARKAAARKASTSKAAARRAEKSFVGPSAVAQPRPPAPAATPYVAPHPVWHPASPPKGTEKPRLSKSAVRTLDAVF